MFGTFFRILKKTVVVIKNEPVILVPYLSFNLMLTIIGQSFELFEKNLLLNGVIQWVIPTLILQPIIIVMALHVIRKDDLQVQQLLLKSRACSWPFFIASLYKPLLLVSAFQLVQMVPEEKAGAGSLPDSFSMWLCLMGVGLICSIIMLFFQAYYVSNYNQKNTENLFTQIKLSILIFLKYKWVSVSFVLYFYMVVFLIFSLFTSAFIAPIVPKHLWPILFSCINGIIITFLQVFILRLYLYIKPVCRT